MLLSLTLLGLCAAMSCTGGQSSYWDIYSNSTYGQNVNVQYQYNSVEIGGFLDYVPTIPLTDNPPDYEDCLYKYSFSDNTITQNNALRFQAYVYRGNFHARLWLSPVCEMNYQVSFYLNITKSDPSDGNYNLYPIYYPQGESYTGYGYPEQNGNYYRQYLNCFSKESVVNMIGFEVDTTTLPFNPAGESMYLFMVFNRIDPYVVQNYLYPNYDETLYNTAYNSGYNQGVQIGYEGGYTAGQLAGSNSGYNLGYQDGYDEGYRIGDSDGYEDGRATGEEIGYQAGLSDGRQQAIDEGSAASVIFNGIISIGLLPTNVFLRILNFEVFGINIGAFVSSLLTIMVLIIIFRMFFGGKAGDN